MRHLLIAGVLVLTSLATSAAHRGDAQQLAPRNTEPLTVRFVNSEFEDIVGFVTRHVGIEVQFDDTATPERRSTKITLNLEKVTLEEALDVITRLAGLSYTVIDPQTIRIYQLP